MLILGIETSCDDTGISIIKVAPTKVGAVFDILSNTVSSQIKVHAKFGGVVPNLAAREHLKNIEPCIKQAFLEANIKPKQIDLIAVTVGPGLIPSLLIGVNFAKALAYKYNKPIIGINHIEAHITAAFSGENSKFEIRNSEFLPAVALVVSGGHTQLVLVKDIDKYKIIGETRDDAAGECFDKVAKLLRLGYPGGPAIAECARRWKFEIRSTKSETNTKYKIQMPRPMIKHKNYDFSFSGLKTAVLYLVRDLEKMNKKTVTAKAQKLPKAQICAEVQQAIIDVLISKTLRAAKEYRAKTIILSGGVAANNELRKQFQEKIRDTKYLPCRQAGQLRATNFLVPPKILCTDNGAMIAMAGYFGARRHPAPRDNSWQRIKANANLRIG